MGVKMESSYGAALLVRLRNLIMAVLVSADKSLLSLSEKSKLLHLLRWLSISAVVLLLHLFHYSAFSLSSRNKNNHRRRDHVADGGSYDVDDRNHRAVIIRSDGRPAIARALHQILSLVNGVPVSSRKYDVVRCLAEKLIDDNLKGGSETLREVNCVALSDAFATTLAQLEAALLDRESNGLGLGLGLGWGQHVLSRAVRAVREWYGPRRGPGYGEADAGVLAEKMAAELLWLAEKLEGSGGVVVAVEIWAWASNLGWLSLSAEPRIQASLVKLTAFLIKQAKEMGREQGTDGRRETEQQKQTNMKMLLTWLPLLCRSSNGTDAPTLSTSERRGIEKALEEIIDMLEEEDDQEKVLSLWLHHFTQCPSSDWPNLHASYIRWCSVSRKLLLTR